jgi:hypothetical protein
MKLPDLRDLISYVVASAFLSVCTDLRRFNRPSE